MKKVYGLRDKVILMGQLIQKGLISKNLAPMLSQAIRFVPVGDQEGELRAIYNQTEAVIRYTYDPMGFDVIRDFDKAIELGIGDCATMTVFIGTMLAGAGFNPYIKLVHPDQGDQWHVFAVAGVPKGQDARLVAVDPVVGRGVGAEIKSDPTYWALYDVLGEAFIRDLP